MTRLPPTQPLLKENHIEGKEIRGVQSWIYWDVDESQVTGPRYGDVDACSRIALSTLCKIAFMKDHGCQQADDMRNEDKSHYWQFDIPHARLCYEPLRKRNGMPSRGFRMHLLKHDPAFGFGNGIEKVTRQAAELIEGVKRGKIRKPGKGEEWTRLTNVKMWALLLDQHFPHLKLQEEKKIAQCSNQTEPLQSPENPANPETVLDARVLMPHCRNKNIDSLQSDLLNYLVRSGEEMMNDALCVQERHAQQNAEDVNEYYDDNHMRMMMEEKAADMDGSTRDSVPMVDEDDQKQSSAPSQAPPPPPPVRTSGFTVRFPIGSKTIEIFPECTNPTKLLVTRRYDLDGLFSGHFDRLRFNPYGVPTESDEERMRRESMEWLDYAGFDMHGDRIKHHMILEDLDFIEHLRNNYIHQERLINKTYEITEYRKIEIDQNELETHELKECEKWRTRAKVKMQQLEMKIEKMEDLSEILKMQQKHAELKIQVERDIREMCLDRMKRNAINNLRFETMSGLKEFLFEITNVPYKSGATQAYVDQYQKVMNERGTLCFDFFRKDAVLSTFANMMIWMRAVVNQRTVVHMHQMVEAMIITQLDSSRHGYGDPIHTHALITGDAGYGKSFAEKVMTHLYPPGVVKKEGHVTRQAHNTPHNWNYYIRSAEESPTDRMGTDAKGGTIPSDSEYKQKLSEGLLPVDRSIVLPSGERSQEIFILPYIGTSIDCTNQCLDNLDTPSKERRIIMPAQIDKRCRDDLSFEQIQASADYMDKENGENNVEKIRTLFTLKFMVEMLIGTFLLPDVDTNAAMVMFDKMAEEMKQNTKNCTICTRDRDRVKNTIRGLTILDAIVSTFWAEGTQNMKKNHRWQFEDLLQVGVQLVSRREHAIYAFSLLSNAIIPKDSSRVARAIASVYNIHITRKDTYRKKEGIKYRPETSTTMREYSRFHYIAIPGRRDEIIEHVAKNMPPPRMGKAEIKDVIQAMERNRYMVHKRRSDQSGPILLDEGRVEGVWNDDNDNYAERLAKYEADVQVLKAHNKQVLQRRAAGQLVQVNQNQNPQQAPQLDPNREYTLPEPPTRVEPVLIRLDKKKVESIPGAAVVKDSTHQEHLLIAQELITTRTKTMEKLLHRCIQKVLTVTAEIPDKILLGIAYDENAAAEQEDHQMEDIDDDEHDDDDDDDEDEYDESNTNRKYPQFHAAITIDKNDEEESFVKNYPVLKLNQPPLIEPNYESVSVLKQTLLYTPTEQKTKYLERNIGAPSSRAYIYEDIEMESFRNQALKCGRLLYDHAPWLPHIKHAAIEAYYKENRKEVNGNFIVYSGQPYEFIQSDYPLMWANDVNRDATDRTHRIAEAAHVTREQIQKYHLSKREKLAHDSSFMIDKNTFSRLAAVRIKRGSHSCIIEDPHSFLGKRSKDNIDLSGESTNSFSDTCSDTVNKRRRGSVGVGPSREKFVPAKNNSPFNFAQEFRRECNLPDKPPTISTNSIAISNSRSAILKKSRSRSTEDISLFGQCSSDNYSSASEMDYDNANYLDQRDLLQTPTATHR